MRMVRRFFPSGLLVIVSCLIFPSAAYSYDFLFPTVSIVDTPVDGGIREEIPKKYAERYRRWKEDLLSTEFGRRQWEAYASNSGFVLTIKISGDKGKGAGTDNFQWDKQGNYVGATITLGSEIDNARDMLEKGRNPHGETHGMAIVNEIMVRKIRERADGGKLGDLEVDLDFAAGKLVRKRVKRKEFHLLARCRLNVETLLIWR